MKKLAYLLSLVVMILSIAPCCALEDHSKQTKTAVGLKKQTSPTEDCCQDCSPFYTCGGCSGFMTSPLIGFSIQLQAVIPAHFNNAYLQSFADGIRPNIWQPPKYFS
ncbi:MAG TPA: DUF6660 family protein [Pedobacter sp.]|nr:DUF6660 family protein [Pedobacter sp.]